MVGEGVHSTNMVSQALAGLEVVAAKIVELGGSMELGVDKNSSMVEEGCKQESRVEVGYRWVSRVLEGYK